MSGNTAPLRVAMVGVHRSLARTPACHNWATAFDAVPETSIAAVFDLGAETRDEFLACWGSEIPAYDDYERMLAEVQPDLVCIATRQTMHADQIEQAVAAGVRGILCDKPLATSPAEMDRIVAACRSKGVPLAFGLDRRWTPAYRYLRRVLAEGAIGAVTSVLGYGLPNLINHGCHWYDTMLGAGRRPGANLGERLCRRRIRRAGRLASKHGSHRARPSGAVQRRPRLRQPARRLYRAAVRGAGREWTAADPRRRSQCLPSSASRRARSWAPCRTHQPQPLDLPAAAGGWTAGPAAVQDLVQAVHTGGSTACDVDEARRSTEIGFALHASSAAAGARVEVPVADRSMRIESYPWGNE